MGDAAKRAIQKDSVGYHHLRFVDRKEFWLRLKLQAARKNSDRDHIESSR